MTRDALILSARVLVVDDSHDDVLLIERLLRGGGYERVDCATDPVAALDAYRRSKPDLVILDLNMPRMSGFEFLDRVLSLEPDEVVPVLMLTGDTDIDIRVAALTRGAKDFLSKPVHKHELLARVRNLVDSHQLYASARSRSREMESSLEDRAAQSRKARLEAVRRLAIAAELRDEATGPHLARMARYCAVLAQAAGVDDHFITQLTLTAPLHDIGKIAIPDDVLLRRGPLDEEARRIMQSHTTLGARILSGSDLPELQVAERIALTHHEWWDGSGYPAGLCGTAIPLEGRICAIGDVFDALTSDRPYKRAWTVDDALEEIVRGRGTQFDPTLVDVFVAHAPALRGIHESFSRQRPVDALPGPAADSTDPVEWATSGRSSRPLAHSA